MDIEDWIHDARPAVPEGLAARIIAQARTADARRRVFWADVERNARRALVAAAAAAVITVAAAVSLVVAPASNESRTAAANLADLTVQQHLEQFLETP